MTTILKLENEMSVPFVRWSAPSPAYWTNTFEPTPTRDPTPVNPADLPSRPRAICTNTASLERTASKLKKE